MKKGIIFEITKDHLKLLQKSNVFWHDNSCYGAPSIHPKKPYGNSSVLGDIACILGWVKTNPPNILSEKQKSEAIKIHRELEVVLQICLSTQHFKTGIYFLENGKSYSSWKKLNKTTDLKGD